MLLLPHRAWSRLVGSGHGAVRHITQWALPVWSTTQVWVPGHTTLEQDSAGKHRVGVTPGMATPFPTATSPQAGFGHHPKKTHSPPSFCYQGTEQSQRLLIFPISAAPKGRDWQGPAS